MKSYNKYKDSTVEWIGEIPNDWMIKKVKYLATVVNGSTPDSGIDKYWDGNIDWVTPADISKVQGHYISGSIRKITQEGLNNCGATLVPKGSVILTTRAPIGNAAIAGKELCTNQGCKSLLFKTNSNFYYYQFLAFKDQLEAVGNGSTFKELSTSSLKSFPFVMPSEKEKNLISSYLDNKTEKINQIIQRKEFLIQKLHAKRQAIINEAVTKGLNRNVPMKPSGVEWLGHIPEHWVIKSIKRICSVKRGASPRPIDDEKYFDDNGEYAWVRIADVTASNKYLNETTQKLSALGASLSVKMDPEDIFLSIAGSVGKPIITKIKCCIHDGFVWFDGLTLNSEFLYYIFLGGEAYKGLGKYGTQLNLNTETVGSIKIAIPPNEEIIQIVNYLNTRSNQIFQLTEKIEYQIGKLKEFKQSLISEVVTGKIKVI